MQNINKTNTLFEIPAEIKQARDIQLEMTKLVLDVCQKHHLRIWADGGTLLGCIRHKGYIPWDDDIDLIMFREDYEKLIDIAPQEINAPFFFQCVNSEQVPYPRAHSQIRKDGTAAILKSDIFYKFHQGIFIDIFVLDNIPDCLEECRLFSDKIKIKRRAVTSAAYPSKLPGVLYNRLMKTFKPSSWNFKGKYAELETTLKQYRNSNSTFVANICLDSDMDRFTKRKLEKKWYDKTIYLPFEDLVLPVPEEYDKILRQLYGEYMIPIKASTSHGEYIVFDSSRSYCEFLPMLRAKNPKVFFEGLLGVLHLRK